MDRELVAEHQADRTGDRAEHDRVEHQDRDHRQGRIAVAAQVGDQATALGHRQEHRVESEQEAHQSADHREQLG